MLQNFQEKKAKKNSEKVFQRQIEQELQQLKAAPSSDYEVSSQITDTTCDTKSSSSPFTQCCLDSTASCDTFGTPQKMFRARKAFPSTGHDDFSCSLGLAYKNTRRRGL